MSPACRRSRSSAWRCSRSFRFYYVGLVGLAVCLWIARNLWWSRLGRSLRALGADEQRRAQPRRAGVPTQADRVRRRRGDGRRAGVLWAYYVRFAAPSTWDVGLTIDLVTYVDRRRSALGVRRGRRGGGRERAALRRDDERDRRVNAGRDRARPVRRSCWCCSSCCSATAWWPASAGAVTAVGGARCRRDRAQPDVGGVTAASGRSRRRRAATVRDGGHRTPAGGRPSAALLEALRRADGGRRRRHRARARDGDGPRRVRTGPASRRSSTWCRACSSRRRER